MQAQLAALNVKNAQLVESYDQAQVDLSARRTAAGAAQVLAQQAQSAYLTARTQLGATMTAQYESGSFSSTGALLTSQDGQSYLEQLQALNMMSTHTAQLVAQLGQDKAAADTAQHKAATLLAAAKQKAADLATQKKAVAAQIAKYTALLNQLTAQQKAAYLASQAAKAASAAQIQQAKAALTASATATVNTMAVPAGGSAQALVAVKFAMAQVGKWYEYGAAGPSTYDCSGLTMQSWAAAGVSLPHSAEDQYNVIAHITRDQLEPGDLIFYYEPIGHVTIYIGNGLVVSAPTTGEQVQIVAINDAGGVPVGYGRP